MRPWLVSLPLWTRRAPAGLDASERRGANLVGAGLALGDAYDEYGIWVTVAGVIILIALIALITS